MSCKDCIYHFTIGPDHLHYNERATKERIECRLNPTTIHHDSDHWCGQLKEKPATEAGWVDWGFKASGEYFGRAYIKHDINWKIV